MKEKRNLQAIGAATTGTGATLLATAASACCVPVLAPLLVSVLGVGGSVWAAGLKPYSPYILIVAGASLGFGFWSLYRQPVSETAACPARRPTGVRFALWASTLIWLVALALNLLEWAA